MCVMKPEYMRHGGAYDRGAADAWYNRPYNPHFFVKDTYSSEKVEWQNMTDEEIAAYAYAYEERMNSGYHKEY